MSSEELASFEAYRAAVNPRRCELIDELEWPKLFAAAAGDRLTTYDGRRFLDLVAEYGAATLGHRHPAVTAALTEALAAGGPFLTPIGVPGRAGNLAQRLCALAGPPLERVYFCTGGAEAVEGAMKFAMAATGRVGFACFAGGYHGLTLGALSVAGADYWRSPLPGRPASDRHVVSFGDVDALAKVLAGNDVAAVLVETVQGLGGARPWGPNALQEVARICAEHGTLLIVDEVLTGIGRTGRWFGFQHHGIEPDIVVISKGLTGGVVPVAAVLMTVPVHEALYSGIERAYVHSSTFEGHLLGMAAGQAVLDVIEEEGLLERATRIGMRLRDGLTDLRSDGLDVLDVRGQGLLLAFRVAGLDAPEDSDGAAICMELLMEQGVLVYQAAHDPAWLKLTPPLNLAETSADQFLEAVRDCLLNLAAYRS